LLLFFSFFFFFFFFMPSAYAHRGPSTIGILPWGDGITRSLSAGDPKLVLKEICSGLDEILMLMGCILMPSCRWQLFDDDHNLVVLDG
jgi:hypothetical protein